MRSAWLEDEVEKLEAVLAVMKQSEGVLSIRACLKNT